MSPTPSASTFKSLTVGVIVFTIYGSLVPFVFEPRTFASAVDQFQALIERGAFVFSKSDYVANVILGVPLGFCALAAITLDKGFSRTKTILTALLLWPWCICFAAGVEFAQLFFKGRDCSASDILAQSLGSLIGILLWFVIGKRFVKRFRRVWQGDRIGGTAGRLLVVYIGLLAIAQWLPLDLTLSPKELFDKNFNAKSKIVLIPFSEPDKLGTWLELIGVFMPVGLLAAGLPRLTANKLILFAPLLAFALELGQLFVNSRTTSLTDVCLGTLGILTGWGLAKLIRPPIQRGISLELGLILLQAWMFFLFAIHWWPFDFQHGTMMKSLNELNWVPFAASYEKNYLNALEEACTKTLLFIPIGVVVAAIGIRRVVRRRTAIIAGVLIALIIEAGQLSLPSRVPGTTDLIFGGLGAWLGAAGTLRLRAYGYGSYQPTDFVRYRVT